MISRSGDEQPLKTTGFALDPDQGNVPILFGVASKAEPNVDTPPVLSRTIAIATELGAAWRGQ